MRKTLRNWLNQGSFALMPLLAQTPPPEVKSSAVKTTQQAESSTSGPIVELMKEWWLWGGILLLIGLVGLLLYLRNKGAEDD